MVMATGIVSTAADRVGQTLIAAVLLVIGLVAFVVLGVMAGWRLLAFREETSRDFNTPGRSFGYFTFVAAAAVIGERLDQLHAAVPAVLLVIAASLSWLLLSYAIPARLILSEHKGTLADILAGNWLLWVVATQSLATIGAMIATHEANLREGMTLFAVWAWSVGVVLYLMLMTVLMLRLLTVGLEPSQLSASYWISMGATAITTLAGARILSLPHQLAILQLAVPVVGGLSLVLWCFGTWWIPLLVIFGIWRYAWRRHPLRYDPDFWSMVFPLGMYSAASIEFGTVGRLHFMAVIGRVEFWPALIAWLLVLCWAISRNLMAVRLTA
jgi:tellurite resistance protein TehA-like permease